MDNTNEWLRRTWILKELYHQIQNTAQRKLGKEVGNLYLDKQKIVPFSAVWWSISIDHKRSEQNTNYFLSVSTIIFHYSMQVLNPWFKQMKVHANYYGGVTKSNK